MIYCSFELDNINKRKNIFYNEYDVSESFGRRASVVLKSTEPFPNGIVPYDMSQMKRKYSLNI